MLLGQILYTSVLSAHTIANQEKQSILQSLVKRQVLYDDSISIDSVIAWSEQLLPTQQSNEDRTTYFLLQLQLANAYTLRGDISLATNRAQLMYEEAKATDYQFGMVVANQAIGDAYNTIANMGDKALESYQDALTELSNISDQHPYRAQLLLKMSNVLQRKGRLEEAEKIYLCKIQGMAMEACRIYQELYPPIDTLASQSYIRQINTIKAKYQVDKAETASNNEYNKIITSILVGTMALVTLFVLLAILLKRQREKVKLSTQKLATSRINAENAMRAKSVFLSNMSHEIRTPLNALSGFSSLLTEEGLDDETRRQCNEVIQQNSELLLKLINDVIDLSSLEFGKLQFCIAQHDAVSICRNVIDTVNKVKQTQAELTFTTELEEMPIETDDSRLQQVLINLLINATKFTPQGSIVLKLEKETDDTVLFTVTDTGCGIPKDKQANIFQRFEKLNENAQGSGLGLSICQLIIEHIGGQIWIDSEYAEGSRFCFTHPISQTGRKENKK